jgi:hypothetical protein
MNETQKSSSKLKIKTLKSQLDSNAATNEKAAAQNKNQITVVRNTERIFTKKSMRGI